MVKCDPITQQRLSSLLSYSLITGLFTNIVNRPGGIKSGTLAGCLRADGYIVIRIDGYLYLAHRLAWLYVTGTFPSVDIDHKDKCRSHNWFLNLREATNQQNSFNASIGSNNKTGYKGVSTRKQTSKFVSRIMVDGKSIHLGYFRTAEEASIAYQISAKHYFKEFAS